MIFPDRFLGRAHDPCAPRPAGECSPWLYGTDFCRPLLPENNCSFAGATSGRDNENDDEFDEPVDFPGLLDQLDEFIADCGPGGADRDALHVVWAGANDFVLLADTGGDPAETIANGVANLASVVQTLAGAGARHIIVLNVPDIGLTPLASYTGESEGLSYLVALYNQALDQVLNQLEIAGIPTIRVATDAALQSMVTMPELYGFTNVADPYLFVGGNVDSFVFFDILHPTTIAHSVLANEAIASLSEFYFPIESNLRGQQRVHALHGLIQASTLH